MVRGRRRRRRLRAGFARKRTRLHLYALPRAVARPQHLPAVHGPFRDRREHPREELPSGVGLRVHGRRPEPPVPLQPQLPPWRQLEGPPVPDSLPPEAGRDRRLDQWRPAERPVRHGQPLDPVPPVPRGQLLPLRPRHGHLSGPQGRDRRPPRGRYRGHSRRRPEPHVRQERLGHQGRGQAVPLESRRPPLVGQQQQALRAVRQPRPLPRPGNHQQLGQPSREQDRPVQGNGRPEAGRSGDLRHPLQGVQEPD